jgi:plasmid stabilization system protein ParE
VHAVIWSPIAVAQLRAIRVYIEQFNPRAADAVAAHLLAAGNGLEHFPHRGRPVPRTSMRELIADYRYIIRYRVTRDGTVRILRIRHSSRRPTNP